MKQQDFKKLNEEVTAKPGHFNGSRRNNSTGKNKSMGRPREAKK